MPAQFVVQVARHGGLVAFGRPLQMIGELDQLVGALGHFLPQARVFGVDHAGDAGPVLHILAEQLEDGDQQHETEQRDGQDAVAGELDAVEPFGSIRLHLRVHVLAERGDRTARRIHQRPPFVGRGHFQRLVLVAELEDLDRGFQLDQLAHHDLPDLVQILPAVGPRGKAGRQPVFQLRELLLGVFERLEIFLPGREQVPALRRLRIQQDRRHLVDQIDPRPFLHQPREAALETGVVDFGHPDHAQREQHHQHDREQHHDGDRAEHPAHARGGAGRGFGWVQRSSFLPGRERGARGNEHDVNAIGPAPPRHSRPHADSKAPAFQAPAFADFAGGSRIGRLPALPRAASPRRIAGGAVADGSELLDHEWFLTCITPLLARAILSARARAASS